MVDKNLKKQNDLKNFDFTLFFLTMAAAIFGIVMVSSAAENSFKYVLVQTISMALGIVGIFLLMILDYEYLAKISRYIFIVCVLLLVLVLIPGIGYKDNGARSWFRFGNLIGIQPAEIVKLGFVITFAKHLSMVEHQINRPRNVIGLLLHVGIIIGLILLQPDFGTAMVFMFMIISMLFVAKIGWRYILSGVGAAALLTPIAWFFFLKDYQKERIINLFNPENDPAGTGYHVIQSKIAVGSGQITGSGLYEGASQFNNLLPERHTDFIYSVVCEELGFIGAVAVILLLTLIIFRILYIGKHSRNSLGRYICVGIATMFAFHTFENIGMCIGIMPVTGIPLPFFSYGGSAMLTNLLAIGMVLNVKFRSKVINF